MAMRSKFFVVACGTFLIFNVDPVAAVRVQKHSESTDSEVNKDVVHSEEQWFHSEDRCLRLNRNFDAAVSRVRAKANRASQSPGLVSTASLVMTLRRLNRNFQLAAERNCSWIEEQDVDSETLISVAHENLDDNPCLPQAQELMVGVDESSAEEMSTVAVQAVSMLISGNCSVVEFEIPASGEQPALHSEVVQEVSDDALDDMADAALEAEEEDVDGSMFLEEDMSLEQKPGPQAYPAYPVQPRGPSPMQQDRRQARAIRAVVAIVLFVLSIGLMCAAGPAVMAVISLIVLSILVLFLAFFYTFIAVALQANPATGNAYLGSYLQSTWAWTSSAFGQQLTNGRHWRQCFAYLR